MTPAQRRELVDRRHGSRSIVRQCALLGVSRSSLYHRPKETLQQALSLMRELDRPVPGNPILRFQADEGTLDRQGMPVSRKRVQRLMRLMGLRAIYRQPRTSLTAPERRVYPDLLRNLTITRVNQSLPPRRRGYGRLTSPTCPWPGDSCTWWPSWTGTAGTWWPGGCPTLWRPAFVPRP